MSSLPFSRLICAKRRSRSPRFDTSPCTPVTFLPISFTAAANSGSRPPVMKTYAPSFTNCLAVARPMPLLPPVTSAIFPSSLPMVSLLLSFCVRYSRSVPLRSPFGTRHPRVIEGRGTLVLHGEHDAEFGFPAHHAGVAFGGFRERVLFYHRPHARHFREAQRVLGIGRDSARPALDALFAEK